MPLNPLVPLSFLGVCVMVGCYILELCLETCPLAMNKDKSEPVMKKYSKRTWRHMSKFLTTHTPPWQPFCNGTFNIYLLHIFSHYPYPKITSTLQ